MESGEQFLPPQLLLLRIQGLFELFDQLVEKQDAIQEAESQLQADLDVPHGELLVGYDLEVFLRQLLEVVGTSALEGSHLVVEQVDQSEVDGESQVAQGFEQAEEGGPLGSVGKLRGQAEKEDRVHRPELTRPAVLKNHDR